MHFWHKRKLHLDLIIYFDKQPISVTKEIQFIGAVLFLETKGWRYERRRRQASAAGALHRAPQARDKAPRGVRGCAHSPEKFLFLELKMASFRAFLLLFL